MCSHSHSCLGPPPALGPAAFSASSATTIVGFIASEVHAHDDPQAPARQNHDRQQLTFPSGAARDATPLDILLVDDILSNRRLVERILVRSGHRVTTATHGTEAVRLARESQRDVILMDLQMPGMDGWQATQAIRREERESGEERPVPIIALTAYPQYGNRERCLAAGMDDYLPKPIDSDRLVEAIERHGRRHRQM